ncbi:MAG: PBP1A family penicillin-binding protein [Acidobacteriota bacterium]
MRRTVLVAAILMLGVASWYAAVRTALLTHAIAREIDGAAVLAALAPRAQASTVFDRTGAPAFSFFVEQRIDVPLDRVSPRMVEAIVAVEDRRFFSHHGIDPVRIVGAAWRNFRAHRIVAGGSTITQQLARAAQLSPVRTYERKMREIMLAAQLERRYTKDQILEEYLNTVYFGEGYYGVESASRGYFGKAASELQPAEAALLAALVRSPSSDAPAVNAERARTRRNLVLRLMYAQGKLTGPQLSASLATSIPDRAHRKPAPGVVLAANGSATGLYFQEEVRRQLFAMFGADKVLRGGLRVYSTYDPAMQREAESAVTTRIAQIVKARPAAKDLQGSFVAMDAVSGEVRALVGGRDFLASSFNRATQAHRQAGSAFKPIIYAAALERGYSPGSILRDLDTPIAGAGASWLPNGGHEKTEYTLRNALRVSSNRAAAQLLQLVGLGTAVYYAQRLGIESQLPMVPSLALGTGEVTLLELTAAYTAFANRGMAAAPRFITRVEDARGLPIYDAPERHTQAIGPTTAFLMSSMLADVISAGSGTAVRAAGFTLPAAGKTGTTDDYADAWFVGYTPHLVAGVWFGVDTPAPIMRGGFAGVVAAPAWGRFMREATAADRPDWYEVPADVERVAICRLSGARATEACRHQDGYALQATGLPGQFVPVSAMRDDQTVPSTSPLAEGESAVYEDLFPVGAVPSELCPLHNPSTLPGSTPTVDSILSQSAPPPSPLVRAVSASTAVATQADLVVERVLDSAGTIHLVLRRKVASH